jgi:signal transduction histidine kinase/CheY-like chemotaxis protein
MTAPADAAPEPAARADEQLADDVAAEQLRMVFEHMAVGTLVATVFAFALAAHVMGHVASPVPVWIWLAAKVGIAVPRALQAQLYRLRGRPGDRAWQRRADLLLAVDGLVWGIGGVWAMNEPVELVAVVVASLCAVASVATFGLQVRLLSTASYVVPMILPPALALLLRADRFGAFAGIGMLLFLGLLLATARRSQTRLAEVFSLRLLTDRISAERAHALEQARRQSLVKTEFLAAMSHELRTPLHGILGLTRVLRGQHDDPELRHRLGLIEHSGEHLLQLINDLIDSSRIEAGRVEVIELEFDLLAELEELIDIYFVRAQERRLRFVTHIDLGAECWVLGDPTRLRQVLHNLLGNALKFTDQGEVSLQVQRLEGHLFEFSVRDTGHGIDPAELPRVFEAFYQAGARRRRAGGAGLGLSIAREMAHAMGGSIRAESEVGRGSLFVLTLPLRPVEPHPNATPRESAWMLGDVATESRRVLLAEDNEVNALVVEAMLERIGCQVTTVDNGDDAVRLGSAVDRDIDVVLMDCQMPVVDGLEATRRIRERERRFGLAPVPVIALTANTTMDDREACRRAGMDQFLGKPFTERELLSAVAACLRHGATGASEV